MCAKGFGVFGSYRSVGTDVVVVRFGTFLRYRLFCAILVCRSVDTELAVVEVRFVRFVRVCWFCSG